METNYRIAFSSCFCPKCGMSDPSAIEFGDVIAIRGGRKRRVELSCSNCGALWYGYYPVYHPRHGTAGKAGLPRSTYPV